MLKDYLFPKEQIKTIFPTLLFVSLISAIVLGFVLFLHFYFGVHLNYLTRDFSALVDAPVYTAFLSQLGMFFWAGAAAICIISGALLSGNQDMKNYRTFFYASAGISLMLGLDDMFLLHESVFPFLLGIPENVVYLGYMVIMIVYGLRYLKILLSTEYILFSLAILFFGLSIIVDITNFYDGYIEDPFKFIGMVFWTTYYFRAGKQTIKPLIQKSDN